MSRTVEPVARVYAEALARTAEEQGGVELVAACGEALGRAVRRWREESAISFYFLSAQVTDAQKVDMLDRLVAVGQGPDLAKNFLRLLLRRNRLLNLPEIAGAYNTLLDRRLGRMPVTLATATPVPPERMAQWTEAIRRMIGREPIVRHVVRPELLAGAVIRAGDVVADGSARRHLNELRRRMIERGTHAAQA